MKVSDFTVNDFYVHGPRPEDISRNLVLELKQGNGADVFATMNPEKAKSMCRAILNRLGERVTF